MSVEAQVKDSEGNNGEASEQQPVVTVQTD